MSYARRFIFRAFALLLIAGLVPLSAYPVQGQAGGEITLENPEALVNFGETITFRAKIKTAQPVKQISLIFRGINQGAPYVEPVQLAEDGSVNFTYDASLNVFPPFSEITFWFQATLADDQTYSSEMVTFPYNDTRFPWKTMSSVNVTVYWYAGDDAFGAQALNMAGAGILKMREFMPVSLSDPIRIYIYSNAEDLQNTLMLGGKDWIGGHAIPEIGVALVAIPPEADNSEFATKIPHELTHLMLYRALGSKYRLQPPWLLEGIAAMVEQYPNPEYKRALAIASGKDALIPFENLCKSFPPDSGGAYLAYAQSQSFVTYVYESYGASGLTRLTDAYGDGLSCELGATRALGIPVSQLDVRWRENVLGQNVTGVAIRNLSPFMLIMALVLVVPLWGMIDLLRQRKKREEQYAEQPKLK
jgi:hypothetical protein